MKALTLFVLIAAAVAAYLYARVDLGMTIEDVNQTLRSVNDDLSVFALAIWVQIFLAAAMWKGFAVWQRFGRHKKPRCASR